MQASVTGQRPSQSQRRQQTAPDPAQPPNPAMNAPAAPPAQPPRTSSGSSRSQRGTNPDKQISQIEKSVTHLLVATKQLLETLTQWSRGQAQEEEVSDVYVRLGYEFNLACRAFNSIGVDTSDLGNVPDLLRHILEDTLSQPASPQALDNYLPRIRDIIINLLHGLKRKQSKLRGRGGKDAATVGKVGGGPARQSSMASTGSGETGLSQMLEDVPSSTSSMRANSRQDSLQSADNDAYGPPNPAGDSLSRSSANRHSLRRDIDRPVVQSESSSSMSSATAQNIPVMQTYDDLQTRRPSVPDGTFPHAPPPPPKQQDALTALQRGGDLERRASRRFSAYQIQKHLGASPNGIPVIPPAQNSPIPNRGREVRESLSAVRSRTSYQKTKTAGRPAEISPGRNGTVRAPQMISEEGEEEGEEQPPTLNIQDVPEIAAPSEPAQDDSPIAKTPEEYHKPLSTEETSADAPIVTATLNGPLSPTPEVIEDFPEPGPAKAPSPPDHQEPFRLDTSSPATVERKVRNHITPPQSQVIDLGSSPPQGKELTLFLQYKSKIKKFVLPEGYDELTLARLQLAFIEKFAWNTHNDGVELPEIYIQDPVSGVRHELEDLSDVKERSVLVLNVEVLDEVKKHFDDGIGGLRKTLDGVKSLLDGQGTMMQRFSDRQLEASKEMARMSAVPSQRPSRTPTLAQGTFSNPPASGPSMQEVQNLRRDIAVLRQTYSSMSSDFASAMNEIKVKAANVKLVATEAIIPSYKGDSGRAHINQGKKTLSHDAEGLVNRVDDLSDVVEELRKDVVTRGVRPLPRQLEDISKEISAAAKELAKVKDFMKREKPIWTKIWEQELQMVMTEREDLTQQDELIADLDGDLEDVTGVFKLVEEATKQQNLQNSTAGPVRSTSRNLAFDSFVDPLEAKTGVLDEVRALQPNHEDRLEAIERAEKARQKELQNRKGGEFHREVEKFVEEGKLKKTGGAEEVERLRKIKDEKARKETWEHLQERKVEMEKKRAARAAAAAAKPEHAGPHSAPEGDNEAPQEDDAALQDANEHSKSEAKEQYATPLPPEKDTPKVEAKQADGPPRLPELDVEESSKHTATKSDTTPASPSSPSSSRSWWQPAIFANT